MSRRRVSAIKPKTVITSIVICAALALAGIGYVWAKTQVWGLSREIKALEVRLDEIKRKNEILQRNYAGMCTPARLDARLKELNSDLSSPQPNQIIRMSEPLAATRQKPAVRIYAASTNE